VLFVWNLGVGTHYIELHHDKNAFLITAREAVYCDELGT
jgi:hypothetical protein